MFLTPRLNTIAVSAIICLFTLVVFLPALSNGFVDWDDPRYITDNHFIQDINRGFFLWMFTTFHASNWHPLTWLSHAVDYRVWGLDPMGHHLTSVLLHCLNTFLVVVLMTRLIEQGQGRGTGAGGKQARGSALVAGAVTGLLFGVHPLHVESVAWVSERKDVLYAFFYLMSVWWYVRYTEASGGRRAWGYAFCVLLFILSLLSKPMAVTLPLVLLILDVYPLRRLEPGKVLTLHRRVLAEKVPFFLLGAASSVLTVMAQKAGGAIRSAEMYPFGERVLAGLQTLWVYMFRMIWPVNLVPFYPLPEKTSIFMLKEAGVLFITLFVIILCIIPWRKRKVFSIVLLYYVITLIPVMGIIKAGWQAAADRYTYLPSLGPFVIIGLGAAWFWDRPWIPLTLNVLRRVLIIFIAACIVSFLTFLTVQQIGIWKDPQTFWSAEMKVFPDNPDVIVSRGKVYLSRGDIQKALDHFDRALRIDPGVAKGYVGRGLAFLMLGDHQKALSEFDEALSLAPYDREAHVNRRFAYEAAIIDYSRIIEREPLKIEPYIKRGGSYAMTGQHELALQDFSRVISLRPELSIAYLNRGLVYKKMGKTDLAIQDFRRASSLGDEKATAYLKLEGIDH
jgi:tetratricopeptide (TPR) repeat protein